jgi:hypothetical protein
MSEQTWNRTLAVVQLLVAVALLLTLVWQWVF